MPVSAGRARSYCETWFCIRSTILGPLIVLLGDGVFRLYNYAGTIGSRFEYCLKNYARNVVAPSLHLVDLDWTSNR